MSSGQVEWLIRLFKCANCGSNDTSIGDHSTANFSDLFARNTQNGEQSPIDQYDACLAVMDAQISARQSALDNLTHHRQEILRERNAYINNRAAVQKIPPEVLSEIFLYCIPQSDPCRLNSISLTTPLVVSQITQRWREAALSTSLLWTDMNALLYEINTMSSTAANSRRALTELWLARSRNAPLTLNINVYILNFNYNESVLQHAEHMAASTDCWGDIGISAPWSYLKQLTGRLPNLKYLSLTVENDVEHNEDFEVFQIAPRLRYLTITNVPWSDISFKIPWTQLITLTLKECTIDVACSIFSQARNLQMFTFDTEHEDHGTATSPVVVHPSLHSLTVVGVHANGLSDLLSRLTLPSLRELSVCVANGGDADVGTSDIGSDVIISFLSRTQNSVRKLTINQAHWSARTLCGSLSLTPLLEDLHFVDHTPNSVDPVVARDVLAALASNTICPQLRTFSFGSATFKPSFKTLDRLLDLVKARQLHRLQYLTWHRLPQEYPAMVELRSHGVVVNAEHLVAASAKHNGEVVEYQRDEDEEVFLARLTLD